VTLDRFLPLEETTIPVERTVVSRESIWAVGKGNGSTTFKSADTERNGETLPLESFRIFATILIL